MSFFTLFYSVCLLWDSLIKHGTCSRSRHHMWVMLSAVLMFCLCSIFLILICFSRNQWNCVFKALFSFVFVCKMFKFIGAPGTKCTCLFSSSHPQGRVEGIGRRNNIFNITTSSTQQYLQRDDMFRTTTFYKQHLQHSTIFNLTPSST